MESRSDSNGSGWRPEWPTSTPTGWRHSYAHQWKLAGGDTGDLMLVLGWTSEDMPRHYGASAAAERALQTQARLGIGERI